MFTSTHDLMNKNKENVLMRRLAGTKSSERTQRDLHDVCGKHVRCVFMALPERRWRRWKVDTLVDQPPHDERERRKASLDSRKDTCSAWQQLGMKRSFYIQLGRDYPLISNKYTPSLLPQCSVSHAGSNYVTFAISTLTAHHLIMSH